MRNSSKFIAQNLLPISLIVLNVAGDLLSIAATNLLHIISALAKGSQTRAVSTWEADAERQSLPFSGSMASASAAAINCLAPPGSWYSHTKFTLCLIQVLVNTESSLWALAWSPNLQYCIVMTHETVACGFCPKLSRSGSSTDMNQNTRQTSVNWVSAVWWGIRPMLVTVRLVHIGVGVLTWQVCRFEP